MKKAIDNFYQTFFATPISVAKRKLSHKRRHSLQPGSNTADTVDKQQQHCQNYRRSYQRPNNSNQQCHEQEWQLRDRTQQSDQSGAQGVVVTNQSRTGPVEWSDVVDRANLDYENSDDDTGSCRDTGHQGSVTDNQNRRCVKNWGEVANNRRLRSTDIVNHPFGEVGERKQDDDHQFIASNDCNLAVICNQRNQTKFTPKPVAVKRRRRRFKKIRNKIRAATTNYSTGRKCKVNTFISITIPKSSFPDPVVSFINYIFPYPKPA